VQLVRPQMRVGFRHRQTLVSQQICDVFEWSPFHPQPARKRMPQVMSSKVFDPRLNNRVVKLMPPILKRLSGFFRLKHTPFPAAPRMHNLKGGYGSIV
jgi:hypothetical protein